MHYTRRQFLHRSAALAAASAVPILLRAVPERKRLSLGMSLYGMKSVPLGDALTQCARIGYRNVELGIDPGYSADPAVLTGEARRELRRQTRDLGLGISAMMLNLNLADPALHRANLAAIKSAATLAHDVSPDQPPPIETVFRGKPNDWDTTKVDMAARLRDWAQVAAEGGIKFVTKAHVTMAVDSPERLLWLLHEVNRPEIRVAYDYSHFEVQGIPLEQSWQALRPYVEFVHVKDTAGDRKKPVFLLPGEGRTDYVKYFQLLKISNYTGPVVVEVSAQVFGKPGYDPVKAAEKSFGTLQHAATETGA